MVYHVTRDIDDVASYQSAQTPCLAQGEGSQVLVISPDPLSTHTAYWVRHCSVRISSSHATYHQTPDSQSHILTLTIRLTSYLILFPVSRISNPERGGGVNRVMERRRAEWVRTQTQTRSSGSLQPDVTVGPYQNDITATAQRSNILF